MYLREIRPWPQMVMPPVRETMALTQRQIQLAPSARSRLPAICTHNPSCTDGIAAKKNAVAINSSNGRSPKHLHATAFRVTNQQLVQDGSTYSHSLAFRKVCRYL
ncbi:MAG: hypothetical protein WBU20_26515 [Candidatus Acidiferrum sp.]